MSTNLTTSTGIGQGIGNITLLEHTSLCTLQTCDLTLASFRYLPSIEANTAFATIFATLLLIHINNGFQYRIWEFSAFIAGGLVLEIIGYVSRVLLHYHPFSNEDFVGNIYALSIGPTLISAAIYLTLGRVIKVYGENLARFSPQAYTLVFAGLDQIALLTQATGGTIASYAKITATPSFLNPGKNFLLAGLIFQVVSSFIFLAALAELGIRIASSKHLWNQKYLYLVNSTRFKLFLVSLVGSTILILVRSMFRVAELWGGFNSKLFTTDEPTFLTLEGGMISIAVGLLTFSHPGYVLGEVWHIEHFSLFAGLFGNSKKAQQKTMPSADAAKGNEGDVELGYDYNSNPKLPDELTIPPLVWKAADFKIENYLFRDL